MISKWISIRSILLYINQLIPPDLYNEATIIEDAARAMDMIGYVAQYENKVGFIKVDNYLACLPVGLRQIIQVANKINFKMEDKDLQDIRDMLGIDNEVNMQNSTLPYQVWLASQHYTKNWTPMSFSTNSFGRELHCQGCIMEGCDQTYSLSPDGTITCSFKKGVIAIAYKGYPTDCDGDFLIPDDEDFKEALKSFCMMRIWEIRLNQKEEGAFQMYKEYQGLWGLYKGKATASIRDEGVQGLEKLKNIKFQLMPNGGSFNSFFGNLGTPQQINFGGYSTGYLYR